MAIQNVLISEIKVRSDWNIRRTVTIQDINSLKNSIAEIGLQHPIVLNSRYEIVAGFRRYQACVALGFKSILSNVIEYKTDLHERLAHIDENLESRNLNEKDMERALAERKRIYETIYPQSIKRGPRLDDAPEKSFATETAEKTGLDERKIRKLTRRVDDVTDEVRIAYEEEKISVSQIDEIVKIEKEYQNKILAKIIGTSVAETRLIVDDFLKAREKKAGEAKTKKDKAANQPIGEQIDEKTVDAIMTCEKLIRSISQVEIVLGDLIERKVLKRLDKDHIKKLSTAARKLTNKFETLFVEIGDK